MEGVRTTIVFALLLWVIFHWCSFWRQVNSLSIFEFLTLLLIFLRLALGFSISEKLPPD